MKICRARPQLVFTFDNRFSSTGCAVQQSVRYVIFCLQVSYLSATSHTGMKSCRVKSLYMKRFLYTLSVLQLSMILYELDYAYFIFFVYCLVYSTVLSRGGRGKDYNVPIGDLRFMFKFHEYELSYRQETPVFGFLLCVVLKDDINPRLCLQNFLRQKLHLPCPWRKHGGRE